MNIIGESDSKVRSSKRRRVPNKFYGYSSDEESEKHQPPVLKWRKSDLPTPNRSVHTPPMVVPPITIKTVPPVVIPEVKKVCTRLQLFTRHVCTLETPFAHHSQRFIHD